MDLMDYKEYKALPREARDGYCERIAPVLPGSFDYLASRNGDILPTFVSRRSGLHFKLIFADTFCMGLSKHEQMIVMRLKQNSPLDIQKMLPPHERSVTPSLISVLPVTIGEYFWMGGKQVMKGEGYPNHPVFVSFDEAESLATNLGCRLPFEHEWEYACRGKTTSVFPWGDDIPDRQDLIDWLDNNFAGNFPRAANQFGFKGLFTGEWCQDKYVENYLPGTTALEGEHVVRGGGSCFWPWQSAEEWIWCMSAMRTRTSALFRDRLSSFRLVRDVS